MLARQSEMSARKSETSLAYWLIPAEPMRRFLAATIAELAARFDGPLFEPHVTIYAGKRGNNDPGRTLACAISDGGPIPLSVRDIQCSDQFVKTVFIQFEPSPQLTKLSYTLQQASALDHKYELNPHLSLIYKAMPPSVRSEVASSITLPFTEVIFDSAKAISGPAQVQSRADVESWSVVAEEQLRK